VVVMVGFRGNGGKGVCAYNVRELKKLNLIASDSVVIV